MWTTWSKNRETLHNTLKHRNIGGCVFIQIQYFNPRKGGVLCFTRQLHMFIDVSPSYCLSFDRVWEFNFPGSLQLHSAWPFRWLPCMSTLPSPTQDPLMPGSCHQTNRSRILRSCRLPTAGFWRITNCKGEKAGLWLFFQTSVMA